MRFILIGMALLMALVVTLPGIASAQAAPPPVQSQPTAQDDNNNSGWLAALLALIGLAGAGLGGSSHPVQKVPEPAAVMFLGLAALPFVLRYVRR